MMECVFFWKANKNNIYDGVGCVLSLLLTKRIRNVLVDTSIPKDMLKKH